MSSLKFGTSGLRGLAEELAGPPAADYCHAFLTYALKTGVIQSGSQVAIGQDLRSTSPEIASWASSAITALGLIPVNLGALPTPALALWCQTEGVAGIMITGSHIPDDRNGLKFYRPDGEIDKDDESGTLEVLNSSARQESDEPIDLPEEIETATERYRERYSGFSGTLAGLTIGLYQHSSVARDVLVELLEAAGANVVVLGWSDRFVPVDTEALRPEDTDSLYRWAREHRLDAIVSTDGDADRPLIADETGAFVLGDAVGALTAKSLGADQVVTPVTSNSALEKWLGPAIVTRTRVGSPHVIAAMANVSRPDLTVVGFEANGGVLLGNNAHMGGQDLSALPTRDAALPILAVLSQINSEKKPLSEISAAMKLNAKRANRLENVASETSAGFLKTLADTNSATHQQAATLGATLQKIDETDGVKFVFEGQSLHYRASGNAPELRCYAEAGTEEAAQTLLDEGLKLASGFVSAFSTAGAVS